MPASLCALYTCFHEANKDYCYEGRQTGGGGLGGWVSTSLNFEWGGG